MWSLQNWQSPTWLMLYFYWSSLFYANDDSMFVFRVYTYPFQWNGFGETEERPSGAFLTLKPVKQNQVAISYYLTLKRPTQVVFWYLHEGLRFPLWEQGLWRPETGLRADFSGLWGLSHLCPGPRHLTCEVQVTGELTGWCLHPATPEQVLWARARIEKWTLSFLGNFALSFPTDWLIR